MRSFWSDPYLWIHLAGVAVVPILLELCVLGFAVGDPVLPVWVELLLVAAIGVAPVLWMQLQRPFYIFSLIAVALKPEQLTDDQRRLLTLFKSQRNQILAIAVSVLLIILLNQIYKIAPLAASVAPFPANLHLMGLLFAAAAFLATNLFAQVPASVLGVMLHSESKFATTSPYPEAQIAQSFSLYGLRVKQILPPIVSEPQPAPVVASSVASIETVETVAPDQAQPTDSEAAEPEKIENFAEPAPNQPETPTVRSEASNSSDATDSNLSPEEDVWDI